MKNEMPLAEIEKFSPLICLQAYILKNRFSFPRVNNDNIGTPFKLSHRVRYNWQSRTNIITEQNTYLRQLKNLINGLIDLEKLIIKAKYTFAR